MAEKTEQELEREVLEDQITTLEGRIEKLEEQNALLQDYIKMVANYLENHLHNHEKAAETAQGFSDLRNKIGT